MAEPEEIERLRQEILHEKKNRKRVSFIWALADACLELNLFNWIAIAFFSVCLVQSFRAIGLEENLRTKAIDIFKELILFLLPTGTSHWISTNRNQN